MTKQKCDDCGTIFEVNEYGQFWCPTCHDHRVREMEIDTEGGYY